MEDHAAAGGAGGATHHRCGMRGVPQGRKRRPAIARQAPPGRGADGGGAIRAAAPDGLAGGGAEHPARLRRPAPWLKDAAIPGTYAGAAAYRDEASRITLDHVRKPFQERIDRLSGRLAGERFNQRFAERLERNLDAARTLKPRRHRIRHTR